MADIGLLRGAAIEAFDEGHLPEAVTLFEELENLDGDPEWARRAAQAHHRLGNASAEVEALNRAARGYQRQGDILKAAVTSKLILGIDPSHQETLLRIPELVAGRNADLSVPPRLNTPPPTSLEDAGKISEAISHFYFSDLLPAEAGEGSASAEVTTKGVRPVPLLGDSEEEFDLDIQVEEAALSIDLPLEVDITGNIVSVEVSADAISAKPAAPAPATASPAAKDDAWAADTLRGTPFGELSPGTFAALIVNARLVELAKDEALFHQGDPGDALYVIASGTLGVIDEGPPRRGVAKLGERSVLGEIALLTNQPRTATIIALSPAQLLSIDRALVGKLAAEDPRFLEVMLRFLRDRLVDRLLVSNPLFTVLSSRDRQQLRRRFKLLEVDAGATLIEQGKTPEGLVILLAGHAEVVRQLEGKEQPLAQLAGGDVAGEISLLTGTPAIATVRATERSLAIQLPASAFRKIVKGRPDAMQFIQRLVDQRTAQAQAIISGTAPHAEGRVPESP